MIKRDIIQLIDAGFSAATGHSLPPEHFLRFVRFKRATCRLYEEITAAQRDFLAETGISPSEVAHPEKCSAEKWRKFVALNDDLLAEAVEVGAGQIPIEFYKALYDENRHEAGGKVVDIFANLAAENIILENLFEKEEENERDL